MKSKSSYSTQYDSNGKAIGGVVTIHGSIPEMEDPETCFRRTVESSDLLSRWRAARPAAEEQVKTMMTAAETANRNAEAARVELQRIEAGERQAVADLMTWSARSHAHPIVPDVITASNKAPSYADAVAHAAGYVDARSANRSAFLASLTGPQREAMQADTAALDKAVALVCAGKTNEAFVLVGELAAKKEKAS